MAAGGKWREVKKGSIVTVVEFEGNEANEAKDRIADDTREMAEIHGLWEAKEI